MHRTAIADRIRMLSHDDVADLLVGGLLELVEMEGLRLAFTPHADVFEGTEEDGVFLFAMGATMNIAVDEGDWNDAVVLVGRMDEAGSVVFTRVAQTVFEGDVPKMPQDWRNPGTRVMDVKLAPAMLDRAEIAGTGFSVQELIEAYLQTFEGVADLTIRDAVARFRTASPLR